MSETTPLDENKLFAHMDAEQIKRVIGCAQPPVREYETGEIIAYQNEPLPITKQWPRLAPPWYPPGALPA